MQIFKPKFWSKKNSLISYSLLPFSLFFQLFLILKKNLSKEEKFSIPVICVGNIYVGGTGKTPLAIEIVKILKKINIKSAIVKKSYKQHNDEFRLIKSKKIALLKKFITGHSN
jgi:tetraacyldisaccharide 4'-kinase